MENVVFTLCFTVFYVFLWNGLINRTSIFIAEELDVCPCWNRKILHLPWMTKDVWNMLTIWSAVSFILVVLFRSRTCDNALENHGRNEERTFFIFMSTKAVWSSWQEREHHWFSHGAVAGRWGQSQDQDFYEYNRRLKDFYVPSGLWLLLTDLIFQDSTSSNALHMTLLHPPPPPHICIQERPFWYSIKTEGSSKLRGTPSLEPIYIYTYDIWVKYNISLTWILRPFGDHFPY